MVSPPKFERDGNFSDAAFGFEGDAAGALRFWLLIQLGLGAAAWAVLAGLLSLAA
jgi:hypothetical protein